MRLLEDLSVTKTWVGLVVLQTVGKDLVAEHLGESLTFHKRLADAAAAHLALVGDNTFRSPWMAAKLLSTDPAQAKASANALVKHVVSTKPGNRTQFEEHLLATEDLWRCLEQFSSEEPACPLWHRCGKYEALFKFLAARFLLAPDHVLDAERVHARWQWGCRQSNCVRLPYLNATLRLRHYCEHNTSFPSDQTLLPHLKAEMMEHKLSLADVDEDVALGYRSS